MEQVLQKLGLNQELMLSNQLHAKPIEISQNSELFKPGDACQLFLVVLTGRVRVELTTKNGRVITLYKIGHGQSCILTTSALLNNERYYARGITESAIEAIAMSSEDFHKALSVSATFSRYILEGFSSRMSSIVSLVDRMATRDITASVAAYLVERHDELLVDVTQRALAMEIGTAREVISRKLSELESQGVIVRNRASIQIINLSALLEISGMT